MDDVKWVLLQLNGSFVEKNVNYRRYLISPRSLCWLQNVSGFNSGWQLFPWNPKEPDLQELLARRLKFSNLLWVRSNEQYKFPVTFISLRIQFLVKERGLQSHWHMNIKPSGFLQGVSVRHKQIKSLRQSHTVYPPPPPPSPDSTWGRGRGRDFFKNLFPTCRRRTVPYLSSVAQHKSWHCHNISWIS